MEVNGAHIMKPTEARVLSHDGQLVAHQFLFVNQLVILAPLSYGFPFK